MASVQRSVWAAGLFLFAVGSVMAQEPAESEKITVVVAKKKIDALWFIKKTEDDFELQQRAKNDVPKGALSRLDDKDLKDGFRIARAMKEGTILTRNDVITKEMGGGRPVFPQGKRAIALKVSNESLVGGFVLPGSKVDVVWTYRTKTGEAGTITILQNLLVLAVDVQPKDEKEAKLTVNTVTLAASPEDAQKLSLAALNGELRLLLRAPGDDKVIPVKPVKPEDIEK